MKSIRQPNRPAQSSRPIKSFKQPPPAPPPPKRAPKIPGADGKINPKQMVY